MDKIAVAIFAYNRPSHLKRVLISIESANIKHIHVFIDGAKNFKDQLIQKQILFMLEKNKNIKIKIHRRKKNIGLANSLLRGVDLMSKLYKKFIILEDDVVPYRNFFKFANLNLKKFEKNNDIAAICGYQFPELNNQYGKKNYSLLAEYFIPWGWATWSNKWIKFRKSLKKINSKKNNKDVIASFFQKKSKKKTIWSANYILYNINNKNRFLYPKFSLVKNIGFDGSGVNSKVTNFLNVVEKKKLENNFSLIINSNNLRLKFIKTYKKRINLFY